MSLGDQKVFPSVIVIINESYTPAGVRHGHATDSGRIAIVGKGAIAVVPIECVHLACEVGNYQVRQAVVVIIREVHSHACVAMALAVYSDSGAQRNFLECAIAFITVKKFGYGVVGDKDVDMAVPI